MVTLAVSASIPNMSSATSTTCPFICGTAPGLYGLDLCPGFLLIALREPGTLFAGLRKQTILGSTQPTHHDHTEPVADAQVSRSIEYPSGTVPGR